MQYLLIVVVIMLITGLSYTVVKWPGGLHMTFSQHVIATRWSKIYYASLFLVTLPLFVWFIGSWLIPQKQLPGTFLWFTCVAALFQLACTWFPETGGWRTTVHRVLTGVSGVAMLPLMFILATTSSISISVRFSAWAALGLMIILLVIAVSNQKGYKWALLLQVGYYATFFAVLLLATYL